MVELAVVEQDVRVRVGGHGERSLSDAGADEGPGFALSYGRREIGLAEWAAARAPIERRVSDARKHLARLTRTSVLTGRVGNAAGLRERWTGLPLTRQAAIVAAVLDHVVVGPGRRGFNRFDPDRFQPVWRV